MQKPREIIDKIYERHLISQCKHTPKHIAIIQDGNRRFAKEKGVDVSVGHKLGARKTEKVLEWAQEMGVRHITLYCFSTENFNRSEYELKELFDLFTEKALAIAKDERVNKNKIRIQMVGNRELVPTGLMEKIEHVEQLTKDHEGFTINLALAYGGRNEILIATRSILEKVKAGELKPEDITTKTIEENLYQEINIPPVDLIIRTGNEKRTSNFLPWLANGNESAVYFCAPYWPVFRKIDLLRGIRVYDQRIKNSHLP
ncbi:di-trans,poly-cis-decaprenylcistransferase [Methanoplanus sp. FWC-SCC4]|uniref:Tritrans,polycis-undecaprenyl-diphosphate synthase (geranylgeranyl-diphosphate specific) n=1 Tax=Methanochimaera problematica TaxID=2609417 RepID=A0AA97FDZ9_9EURY|nr:polyprenyl diphosphate synthase [Methanoplanus sp. FWC-SCC4]WOF17317.1 di-trans,poly-cis-decaprenylcistransferase [Methanoplanus sp. FWC-SCC4]